MMRRAWPWLLAAGAGALWGQLFGERAALLAPALALAPLCLLLAHPRAGRLAALFLFSSWLSALPWIAPTLVVFGHLPTALGLLGWALLAAILTGFSLPFIWLAPRLWQSGRAAVRCAGVPALWVLCEVLRTHLLSGFPWNLAAYSWIGMPGALLLASWIGAYGVSGLIVLVNVCVAHSIERRRVAPALTGVLAALLFLALAGRFAAPPAVEEGEIRTARILQPNIENMVFFEADKARQNYEKVIAMSRAACSTPGGLLLWPESAAWPYVFDEDPVLAADLAALAAAGCPVLFNSVHRDGNLWFNSAYLVSAEAAPARYDKRHLVPWGEYVPFAGIVPFYDRLARSAGDFTPAERLTLLSWGSDQIGLALCYEVVFPAEVASAVTAGATVLATLTNDAWYGDTAAPWQHLSAARFRAAENRRPLLRAAITGVSAVISPAGQVLGQLGVGAEGILKAQVVGRRDLTLYTRTPWAVPAFAALLSLLAIIAVRRGH